MKRPGDADHQQRRGHHQFDMTGKAGGVEDVRWHRSVAIAEQRRSSRRSPYRSGPPSWRSSAAAIADSATPALGEGVPLHRAG
ncbi:MAG: hypothetical protein R2710_10220 [Acidimicrobiales bacterium]